MGDLVNFFGKFFNILIVFLEKVLPRSPFREYLRGYEDGGSGLLKAVNYFVPIPTFIAIASAWVTAMFLYYLYHGLIDKIWHAENYYDRKVRGTFIKNVINFFGKLIGKL